MSRLKRIAISTALTLTVLGGTTMLWYQSHYVAPVVLPSPPPLPSPNGFDTLEEAKDLQRLHLNVNGKSYIYYKDSLPLAIRQKLLAANKPCLEKTREALAQDYRVPPDTDPTHFPGNLRSYSSHQQLLEFAAKTYTESGNLSEAMRCALDSIEVGVMVPRGGRFQDWDDGNEYEEQGRQQAWLLAGRVDATTARAAVARLERIEARRWPLAESLREELAVGNFARELSVFRAGPVYVWEKLGVDSASTADPATEKADHWRELWQRAQAVYYGPRWVAYRCDDMVTRAQARFDSPWQPDRPVSIGEAPYSLDEYGYKELLEYFNRAQCALLKAFLARCAFEKERGAAPRSLEELVSAGYLKAVPVDPFSPTRAPLRYEPGGKLWSIGPDAVDNNGQGPSVSKGQRYGDVWHGDLLPGKAIHYPYIYFHPMD